MKKYLGFLFLALVSYGLRAQDQPYQTKTFTGQKISRIISETSGGNISVEASGSPRVEIYVRGNHKDGPLSEDQIQAKLERDYDLTVAVNNGLLTATAKPKHNFSNWKDALSISFHIYAPSEVSSQLHTSGGNVLLSGLNGDEDFETSGGNLQLSKLNGKIKGRTSGGNIYLEACRNELNLSTSGGNIRGKDCTGQIGLTTSGGSIQMENMDGRIDASTSGGNIEADKISGELAASTSGGNVSLQKLSCSLKTSTSGGNIDVSIEKAGKYVSIRNSAGRIHLTIPRNTGMDLKLNASKISAQNLPVFHGTNSREEINGTVNGGGIPVTVEASGGNLDVVFD